MTLRTSLKKLIRRDTATLSLRERAADLQARIPAKIQPDPVLLVVEEGRRLLAASREAFRLPDVGLDPHPDREAAQDAVWAHFRGALSSTVPTTAHGCSELARYAGEFREFQGVELGDELAAILANIARSPMPDAGAQEGRQAEH
jgi:hypothetical protein